VIADDTDESIDAGLSKEELNWLKNCMLAIISAV